MDLNHPKHGFTAKPCLVGFGIRRNIVASAASLVNVANPSYLSFPSGIRHFESSQASKVSRRNPPWWDSQSRMPGTALEGARIKASDCLGLEVLAMQLFCVAMYLHPGWPLKRPFLFRHACLFFQALHSTHEKQQQQHASLKLGPPALHNFNSLQKAVSTRWKPY